MVAPAYRCQTEGLCRRSQPSEREDLGRLIQSGVRVIDALPKSHYGQEHYADGIEGASFCYEAEPLESSSARRVLPLISGASRAQTGPGPRRPHLFMAACLC
jgi:hypothetical protein